MLTPPQEEEKKPRGRPKQPNSVRSLREQKKAEKLEAKKAQEIKVPLSIVNLSEDSQNISPTQLPPPQTNEGKDIAFNNTSDELDAQINGILTKEVNPDAKNEILTETSENPELFGESKEESGEDGEEWSGEDEETESGEDGEEWSGEDEETETEEEISDFEINEDGDGFKVGLEGEEMAEFAIDMVNDLMTEYLPKIYESDLMTVEERRNLRVIMQKHNIKKSKLELTEEEYLLLCKSEEVDEYAKKVPFTEKQKLKLKKPLAKMLVGKGIKMSPEWAFLIALGIILLPRISPIISQKWKKSQNKPQ